MCKCRPIYELIEAPYDLRKSDRKILDYRSDEPFTRPHKQFLVAFLVQDIHLDNVFLRKKLRQTSLTKFCEGHPRPGYVNNIGLGTKHLQLYIYVNLK